MSDLTLFASGSDSAPLGVFEFDGATIRTLVRNGEPRFIAVDVCDVLDHRRPGDLIRRLGADEYEILEAWEFSQLTGGVTRDPRLSGQRVALLTESGLYSAILWSAKPEAVPFRRWITREVLPAIRRTGQYVPAPRLPQSLPEALRAYADQVELADRQARELEAARPAVDFHDRLMSAEGSYLIGDVAKVINVRAMGQNNLFRFLRAHGVLIAEGERRNSPKQVHVEAERFVVKVGTRLDADGDAHTTRTTYVTPKGVAYVRRLLAEAGYDA